MKRGHRLFSTLSIEDDVQEENIPAVPQKPKFIRQGLAVGSNFSSFDEEEDEHMALVHGKIAHDRRQTMPVTKHERERHRSRLARQSTGDSSVFDSFDAGDEGALVSALLSRLRMNDDIGEVLGNRRRVSSESSVGEEVPPSRQRRRTITLDNELQRLSRGGSLADEQIGSKQNHRSKGSSQQFLNGDRTNSRSLMGQLRTLTKKRSFDDERLGVGPVLAAAHRRRATPKPPSRYTKEELRKKLFRAMRSVLIMTKACIAMRREAMEKTVVSALQLQHELTMREACGGPTGSSRPASSLLSADSRQDQNFLASLSKYEYGESDDRFPEWAKQITSKPYSSRTVEEIQRLHEFLYKLTDYKEKYSKEVQMLICKTARYVKYESRRVILREGHPGHAFYIILSGSVFINVKDVDCRTMNTFNRTDATLSRGQSFGDMALIRCNVRNATVVSKQNVELIMVFRESFSRYSNNVFHGEFVHKLSHTRAMRLMNEWPLAAIESVCIESTLKEYPANALISADTVEDQHVYLITGGTVAVLCRFNIHDMAQRVPLVKHEGLRREDNESPELLLEDSDDDQTSSAGLKSTSSEDTERRANRFLTRLHSDSELDEAEVARKKEGVSPDAVRAYEAELAKFKTMRAAHEAAQKYVPFFWEDTFDYAAARKMKKKIAEDEERERALRHAALIAPWKLGFEDKEGFQAAKKAWAEIEPFWRHSASRLPASREAFIHIKNLREQDCCDVSTLVNPESPPMILISAGNGSKVVRIPKSALKAFAPQVFWILMKGPLSASICPEERHLYSAFLKHHSRQVYSNCIYNEVLWRQAKMGLSHIPASAKGTSGYSRWPGVKFVGAAKQPSQGRRTRQMAVAAAAEARGWPLKYIAKS